MKKTTKLVLMSVLTIAMCVSLIAGATFALFTSEDSVNIAVSSGKVEISATIGASSLYTKLDGNKTPMSGNMWTNGGTVGTLDGQFTLDRMTPGDGVIIPLTITNGSNVAIQYQIRLSSDNEIIGEKGESLLDVLDVNVEESTLSFNYYDGLIASDWTPFEGDTASLKLNVYLPQDVDNNYQGLSCTFTLTVYAVQGNAKMTGITVSNANELKIALANKIADITLTGDIAVDGQLDVDYEVSIDGGNHTVTRNDYDGNVFVVKQDAKLTLANITVDGGAIWSTDDASTRDNLGATVSGNLITTEANGKVVLNAGTVLQNNDGNHAVSLATRGGGSLIMNDAQIINNRSGSGAIFAGGYLEINGESKINGNSSTGDAGAIRAVGACDITINGGEICNNYAPGNGGAIWGYGDSVNRSTFTLNSGKMEGNVADGAGGAIWSGNYATIYMDGDFEICNNYAGDAGGMRLTDHTALYMTGGKIYGNVSENNHKNDGFYGWNLYSVMIGGEIADNITINGGLTPTVGGDGTITGVIHFALSTNHNTVNLVAQFGEIKFTVAENGYNNFAAFNFKAADDYEYTEGDEAKLVCMNEGYHMAWNEANHTFRITADN